MSDVGRTWLRRVGLVTAGALATTTPVLMADEASDGSAEATQRALAAAAAWSDLLDGQAAPQAVSPSPTESAIVLLEGASLARRAPAERALARTALERQQREFAAELAALGGHVNFNYTNVVNGVGVRVPTGRLPLVAALPGVRAVTPVRYLAPAQTAATAGAQALPLPTTTPTTPAAGSADPPQTIALIDAGIQPLHPRLGGAIGPDRLVIGGQDYVDGDSAPLAGEGGRIAEAHGTEMAGIVLSARALQGLAPELVPRLRAYRVVAREKVDGRVRALARSDRVLAALDRAVDPDGNGDLSDRAAVILLGVSGSGASGAADPLAQAAGGADAAGSLVVAPAGNDGPSPLEGLGTVAGVAAADTVLTVGGLAADTTPRTATLQLDVGPASAKLTELPLLGPRPPDAALPTVVLAGSDGLVTGTLARDYADARGQSRVRGALVVVGRGGGTLQQKARAAAQAGAAALAVWDQDGGGKFPGIHGDGELALPIVGLGRVQGRLLMDRAGIPATIVPAATEPSGAMVASFSSRGPAVDGSVEPDLIAPAVDVLTAYPGEGAEQLVARMSGTSAAAAQVAAMALRVRVDNPALDPAAVRSLMQQSAQEIPGVSPADQGAGVATMPASRPIAFAPGVVGGRRAVGRATNLGVVLHELEGRRRTVRLAVTDVAGAVVTPPGDPLTIEADGRVKGAFTVPAGAGEFRGYLNAVADDNTILGRTPVLLTTMPAHAVGIAVAAVPGRGSGAQVRVTVGGSARRAGAVHALRITLVPASGGTTIPLSAPKIDGEWPLGSYRFVLRADASGTPIPAGRYRVRVTALDPGGQRLRAISRPIAFAK